MKNMIFLLVFSFTWLISGPKQAHAFYVQDSIELSYPKYSPYPYMLGQPIDILPQGFITINVSDENFYYCNGIFYQRIMRDQKYMVVPPPVGGVVYTIPQGYQYMFIDGVVYYECKGVYYQRVLDGYKVIFPPA